MINQSDERTRGHTIPTVAASRTTLICRQQAGSLAAADFYTSTATTAQAQPGQDWICYTSTGTEAHTLPIHTSEKQISRDPCQPLTHYSFT